jgi:hypothetical protein
MMPETIELPMMHLHKPPLRPEIELVDGMKS